MIISCIWDFKKCITTRGFLAILRKYEYSFPTCSKNRQKSLLKNLFLRQSSLLCHVPCIILFLECPDKIIGDKIRYDCRSTSILIENITYKISRSQETDYLYLKCNRNYLVLFFTSLYDAFLYIQWKFLISYGKQRRINDKRRNATSGLY